MMMSLMFVQFANFLGRFQWLTCPRKVTILIWCSHLGGNIYAVANDGEINSGFSNWLASV